MIIEGKTYTDKKAAGSAILEFCHSMKSPDAVPLGQYRGFDLVVKFDQHFKTFDVDIKGERVYPISLGTDIFGNIQRIDNALASLESYVRSSKEAIAETQKQLETAKIEAQRPFPQEDELKEKQARLDELNIELNMDKRENEVVDDDRDEGENESRSARECER
jgi:hypothetical protein